MRATFKIAMTAVLLGFGSGKGMNAFTIIKLSQEDKTVKQKGDPNRVDRDKCPVSVPVLFQEGVYGIAVGIWARGTRPGYIADRTIFDHFPPRRPGRARLRSREPIP